jgi:hypothetical protein
MWDIGDIQPSLWDLGSISTIPGAKATGLLSIVPAEQADELPTHY